MASALQRQPLLLDSERHFAAALSAAVETVVVGSVETFLED